MAGKKKNAWQLLTSHGWKPVVKQRTVGQITKDGRKIPVVDGFTVIAWTHPALAYPWPEPDAILLEMERRNGDRQVLSILGEIPN